MPKIDFDFTRGEIPRFSRSIAPDGFAECAINTKLWHGVLEAFPCPEEICSKGFQIKSFDVNNLEDITGRCECVAWPDEYELVSGFCDLSFRTGESICPQVTDDVCSDDWCRLGVPCPPNTPPSVTASDSCDGQVTQVVYRYVNKFGHVGVPSLPSNDVCIGSGGTVSGIATPDAEWCVTHVDLFASISGLKLGTESAQAKNTGAMFLGRYPIADSINTSLSVSSAGFELDSTDNFPPVCGLRGISQHHFGLMGFEGKNFWYTKSGTGYAWNNYKCVDHEIKAVGFWNNNAFVLTECLLYSFPLEITEKGYDFGLPFVYGGRKFPMLGTQKSLAIGQSGIMFPSAEGFLLADNRKASYISDRLFAIDDWCRIEKQTMSSVYTNYGYIFFNDNVSYVVEVPDGTFDIESINAYRLPFNAQYADTDCNGVLYYADGNKVYKWDQCKCVKHTFDCGDDGKCICCDCCEYFYRTAERRFDQEQRLTDGVILFKGENGTVTLKIYDSGCRDRLIFEGTFDLNSEDCGNYQCDRKYFVMDSCTLVESVYMTLEGCAEVRRVSLATARSAI